MNKVEVLVMLGVSNAVEGVCASEAAASGWSMEMMVAASAEKVCDTLVARVSGSKRASVEDVRLSAAMDDTRSRYVL